MAAISLDKEIKQYLPLPGTEQKQSLLSQIKFFFAAAFILPRKTLKKNLKPGSLGHKIRWGELARYQLKEACNSIRKDSFANAEKVRKAILTASWKLYLHPEKYPADKDKTDTDGSYRVFVLYNFRISYKIQESEIIILRMRHTKMYSLKY